MTISAPQSSLLAILCNEHSIFYPTAEKIFSRFKKNFIPTLSYYDENLLEIYTRAFIFRYFRVKKASVRGKIYRNVFRKALIEIKNYYENEENLPLSQQRGKDEKSQDEESFVCNLYSIK